MFVIRVKSLNDAICFSRAIFKMSNVFSLLWFSQCNKRTHTHTRTARHELIVFSYGICRKIFHFILQRRTQLGSPVHKRFLLFVLNVIYFQSCSFSQPAVMACHSRMAHGWWIPNGYSIHVHFLCGTLQMDVIFSSEKHNEAMWNSNDERRISTKIWEKLKCDFLYTRGTHRPSWTYLVCADAEWRRQRWLWK